MSVSEEFNKELEQAKVLLENIEVMLGVYKTSVKHEFVHWGHVGDISHIKSQLQEIVSWLSGE